MVTNPFTFLHRQIAVAGPTAGRVAAVVAVAASVALAQRPVSADERLRLDTAKRVAAAAVEQVRKGAGTGAIAVVDDGGHLVYLERLENTFPAAAIVAFEKARTAAVFRRPTKVFEEAIASGRSALLGVAVMTPLEGGVPIVVNGRVVGAVGVSGAASAAEDEVIARAAVKVVQE